MFTSCPSPSSNHCSHRSNVDRQKYEIAGQARDTQEAIASILELKPDVVILDIRMPMGSGIEVLRTIKHHNHAPVVIMLTNYPYPQYRRRCMDAGADFFLDKSSEFHKIVEILEQLLNDSAQHSIPEA